MALKTGYKVNGKEIILEDFGAYGDDSVKNAYNVELKDYYKVNGETIKASYYVGGKGQILAELPGDNYYKTPSGITIPKFALYGTNTVGGYFDGHESNHWKKFNGYTNKQNSRDITISFDGTNLTATEDGNVTNLRTYELDDHTPLDLDIIKVWFYAVGSGGGGSSHQVLNGPQAGGGGGGASAIICFRLYKNDSVYVSIPGSAPKDVYGISTIIRYANSTKSFVVRGGANGPGSGGGAGGKVDEYEFDDHIIFYESRDGGTGGEFNKKGADVLTLSRVADYLQIWEIIKNPGGETLDLTTDLAALYAAGGGASGFPGGHGGYGSSGGHMEYVFPGPGGGGSGIYTVDGKTLGGTGGPGAFWILYA